MDTISGVPTDVQPDLARLLPRDAFAEVMTMLRGALPPPESGDPADFGRRDRAALTAVAGLMPVTGAEGRLAAQFVAADAWVSDCLRQSVELWREPSLARQCRSQAMSMMREAKSALRLLLKLQAERKAMAEDEAGQAEWVEHAAAGMLEAGMPAVADPVEARIFRSVLQRAIRSRNRRSETKAVGGGVRAARPHPERRRSDLSRGER